MEKGEPIDFAVGIMVHAKVGDGVEQGQPIFTIHARDERTLEDAKNRLKNAVTIAQDEVEPLTLFYGVVG